MSLAKEVETTQLRPEDDIFPKGDLYSDEHPLETELHLRDFQLKK